MGECRIDVGRSSFGFITTRTGGHSHAPYDGLNLATHVGDDPAAVAANRREVEAGIRAPITWMDQVHGNRVAVLTEPALDTVAETDALVTATKSVALGVLVADCVPVLMNARGVVGVAHAGRRGLMNGVVPRAVEAMIGLGALPEDIVVSLGPAICGRCYEVPTEMQAEVEAIAPGSSTVTTRGTAGVDIRAGLIGQLVGAGVQAGMIANRMPCTAENGDYYSHRRDGVTGRFAGVIVARP